MEGLTHNGKVFGGWSTTPHRASRSGASRAQMATKEWFHEPHPTSGRLARRSREERGCLIGRAPQHNGGQSPPPADRPLLRGVAFPPGAPRGALRGTCPQRRTPLFDRRHEARPPRHVGRGLAAAPVLKKNKKVAMARGHTPGQPASRGRMDGMAALPAQWRGCRRPRGSRRARRSRVARPARPPCRRCARFEGRRADRAADPPDGYWMPC